MAVQLAGMSSLQVKFGYSVEETAGTIFQVVGAL